MKDLLRQQVCIGCLAITVQGMRHDTNANKCASQEPIDNNRFCNEAIPHFDAYIM